MSDGPFKMKGYTYPGEAPSESPNKFSWKRFKKGAAKGSKWGLIGSVIQGFKAGNQELKGFDTSADDNPTIADPRRDNLTSQHSTEDTSVIDNPADETAVENELANVSDEEKDEKSSKRTKWSF